MSIIDLVIALSELGGACLVLGFCGAFGVVCAFLLISKLFEDDDDGHSVIGH